MICCWCMSCSPENHEEYVTNFFVFDQNLVSSQATLRKSKTINANQFIFHLYSLTVSIAWMNCLVTKIMPYIPIMFWHIQWRDILTSKCDSLITLVSSNSTYRILAANVINRSFHDIFITCIFIYRISGSRRICTLLFFKMIEFTHRKKQNWTNVNGLSAGLKYSISIHIDFQVMTTSRLEHNALCHSVAICLICCIWFFDFPRCKAYHILSITYACMRLINVLRLPLKSKNSIW